MPNDSAPPFENRRKHERIRKQCKVRFGSFWNLPKISWEHEGDVVDMGGGGIRFVTGEQVREGTQLILVMEFPGWLAERDESGGAGDSSSLGALKVIAEVLRVQPSTAEADKFEVAVRFSGRIRI